MFISVFHFQDPQKYLSRCFQARKKENPKFSIRAWSKELGFRSHSILVHLLSGEKKIRPHQVSLLCKGLGLNLKEADYLKTLVEFQHAQKFETRVQLRKRLRHLNPHQNEWKEIELDRFEIISEWIHMAILAMADLKGFQAIPQKIAQQLITPVSPHEIRLALNRLKQAGLLVADEEKGLNIHHHSTSTSNDIPNEGLQKYHRDVMSLASQALENTQVKDREFQALSITIEKKDLPLAKEMIRKFCKELNQSLLTTSGDEVYQLNLQFFPLLKSTTLENLNETR